MPAPIPPQVTNPPSGELTTLEIATPSASPTFQSVAVGSDFAPKVTGTTTKYATYGEIWDYSVKTGLSLALTIKTAAPDADAAMQLLKQAAIADATASQLMFRTKAPDGSWLSGTLVVKDGSPQDPVRGVGDWQFDCESTGAVAYTTAAAGA